MAGPYTSVSHTSPVSDGSATDLTVLLDAIGAGLYTLEQAVAPLQQPFAYAPTDYGMLTWNYDPDQIQGGTILATAGTVNIAKVKVPVAISATNVILHVNTAGVTLTANQCLAGLYQNGNLIGVTGDQSGTWNSTGWKQMALPGGPFSLTPGTAYVAFYANGSTLPQFSRAASGTNVNPPTGTNYRHAIADTGRTTSFPLTLGAQTGGSQPAYWAGVS